MDHCPDFDDLQYRSKGNVKIQKKPHKETTQQQIKLYMADMICVMNTSATQAQSRDQPGYSTVRKRLPASRGFSSFSTTNGNYASENESHTKACIATLSQYLRVLI